MTSTNTYIDKTIPYFYIIQHKISKKLYAGSKWAKGCNPNTFMIPDGYTTSSPTINSIIEQEGLDSFEILRIDTNLDGLSSYEYETLFLHCNNCAKSNKWLNGHNNTGMAFGLPSFQEKSKQTCLEKYGAENAFQSLLIQEKSKQTCLEKYGVEYYFQSKEFNKKNKKICIELYGVENVFQSPLIQEKSKQTCLENYGYEYAQQSLIVKEKIKQTNLERTGYDHAMKSPKSKEKTKSTVLSIYGVDNVSKIQVECPHCNKVGGKSGMMSKHFNNCHKNPDFIKFEYLCSNCLRIFYAKNTFSYHKKCCDKTFNKIIS